MADELENSVEGEETDIFEEVEQEAGNKKKGEKKPRIKTVSGEEKSDLKETIKSVLIAKAVQAAKRDDETIPLGKEEGIKETGAKAGVQVKEGEKDGGKAVELNFLLAEGQGAFIGRKKGVFEKYGMQAALYIGRVQETPFKDTDLYLDGLNPHVVFVCGSRGSGKSYLLGVLAEELAVKNKNVGIVVIDPVGVFWSMRFPNREDKEIELLARWGMLPQGLKNVKVFIPDGVKEKVPKTTFDATFSIQPPLLTTDDWCLTFGIDRFSPTGLLLEKGMEKVRKGYRTQEGKEVKGRGDKYSLEDLIDCLRLDTELNSTERGFKPDSVRALVSRFDSARSWGVFSATGTPLSELSTEGQLTIIDTSFLDENVGALVIGIIARRVLAARKISTRREAAQRFKDEGMGDFLDSEIPPTWLFIDEAHTLIPSGNVRTPASNALVEYVKQGRQPGCSLVFATQQPSAIDTRVLSQLDIIFTHKLVFDDDIKAVFKRTPTVIPKLFRHSSYIKTLPVGMSIGGDRREETSRAFLMKTRPRMSQHEGREAVTTETKKDLDDKQVRKLAVEMAFAQLEREGSLDEEKVIALVHKLNEKYNSRIQAMEVISALEKKGAVINPKDMKIGLLEKEAEKIIEEEPEKIVREGARSVLGEKTELLAFPARIDEGKAIRIVDKMRKKKLFGLIGEEERVEKIVLKYLPVYKVFYNYFNTQNTFNQGLAYIDSFTGEFLQFDSASQRFIASKGLKELNELSELEVKVLLAIGNRKTEQEAIEKKTGETKPRLERALDGLLEKGIIAKETAAQSEFFSVKKQFDLPPNPLHPLLESLNRMAVSEVEALELQREVVDKTKIIDALKKLWKKLVVTSIKQVYLPFYEAVLRQPYGKHRRIWIEAVTGKEMDFIR